jgi:Xaa-Pro dipeptidase
MTMTPPTADELFPDHLGVLAGRATQALAACACDALVIGAGELQWQFLDDQPYPFKVNPHFKAWVPVLDAPGSALVYAPGTRPKLLFHQPQDYWHQPPHLPEERWLEHFEVVVLRDPQAAAAHVPAGSAYVGPPAALATAAGVRAVNPSPALDLLHYARAAKTPYELECMRMANRRAARGHRAAALAFADGASEYDIHLTYLEACGHTEAELPYPNIIAQNEAAAVLHYTELRRASPADRCSLLIDAGAEWRGYAADVTRTHPAAAGLFADLVAALDAAQQRLCALVRPGTAYPAIHAAAHREIALLLVAAGLVRCSADAALATGLTRVFFPHGVGHLLGLQVHDVGGFLASPRGGTLDRPQDDPYLRLTRTLEENFVVTIEPGIYFIELLLSAAWREGRGADIDWPTVDALRPWGGVRIEDNVVARRDTPENLTRSALAAG